MADDRVSIEVAGQPVSDANPLPTKAASNTSGPVTVADGADVAEGAKADAAWAGSGSGTVVAILKAIYAKAAATLGFSVNAGTTDATTLRVITASDGPLNTNLGTTTDAAVTTDTNGSVSSKLRGLVKLFADVWDSANHALYVRFKTGSTVTAVAARSSDVAITAAAGRLHGFSFAETTGSAVAKAYLKDGTDSTGPILCVITLAPNESARDYFGDRGLAVATGIWLDMISGSIEGAVYSGAA